MYKYLNQNLKEELSRFQVEYWKKVVLSNLKIGVEIEVNVDDIYEDDFMEELDEIFETTDDLKKIGKFGVLNVHEDGSISNGAEIVTVGRRVNFLSMYNQYKYIVEQLMNYKTFVNGRTGLHNHMLLSYFEDNNSMECKMPGIIFKNFCQLVRKHMRELVFITSTIFDEHNSSDNETIITRYNYFCNWEKFSKITPANKLASEYINMLDGERYRFINFAHIKAEDDNIDKFHLELRFPDGSIFPAQIAAQGVLYTALLIKAIELSEFGLVSTGDIDEWEETKNDMKSLRNDWDDDDRISKGISNDFINKLSKLSKDMITSLKEQICAVDKYAYNTLYELAEKPISLRMYEKHYENETLSIYDLNKKVNSDLNYIIQNDCNLKSDYYDIIAKSIILQEIKADGLNDWIIRFSQVYNIEYKTVKNELNKIRRFRRLKFDKESETLNFI